MRVLMVGAGGVGDAAARIAVERDFFEAWVVADYDLGRAERTVAAARRTAYGRGAVHRRPGRRLRRRRGGRAGPRGARHPRLQRRRPAVRDADLHRRAGGRRRLPRHGDEPVGAPPRRALRAGRGQARRRAVRPGRRVGGGRPAGAARHRRRARALRRLRALRRRRALRPHRRARHPRRRQPGDPRRRRQRGVRPRLLDVDDHRGVPQPARGVGARARPAATWRRGSSRCRPSPSPRSSTSPRASARSSACTSSTRRCSSCRAGSRPTG